jgi:hypothetical protein
LLSRSGVSPPATSGDSPWTWLEEPRVEAKLHFWHGSQRRFGLLTADVDRA